MSFKYLVAIQKEMCYRIIDCFRLDKLGAPKSNDDFVKLKLPNTFLKILFE